MIFISNKREHYLSFIYWFISNRWGIKCLSFIIPLLFNHFSMYAFFLFGPVPEPIKMQEVVCNAVIPFMEAFVIQQRLPWREGGGRELLLILPSLCMPQICNKRLEDSLEQCGSWGQRGCRRKMEFTKIASFPFPFTDAPVGWKSLQWTKGQYWRKPNSFGISFIEFLKTVASPSESLKGKALLCHG